MQLAIFPHVGHETLVGSIHQASLLKRVDLLQGLDFGLEVGDLLVLAAQLVSEMLHPVHRTAIQLLMQKPHFPIKVGVHLVCVLQLLIGHAYGLRLVGEASRNLCVQPL